MKKNGLLQTFFYDFLKIQLTNYGSFEEMKKDTSAIHGAMFFFYQKGHGTVPFYFSLDKTLVVVDQNIKNVSQFFVYLFINQTVYVLNVPTIIDGVDCYQQISLITFNVLTIRKFCRETPLLSLYQSSR